MKVYCSSIADKMKWEVLELNTTNYELVPSVQKRFMSDLSLPQLGELRTQHQQWPNLVSCINKTIQNTNKSS